MLTALNLDGTVDFDGMHREYERLIKAEIDGIVILGSSGEFYAFDEKTILEIVEDAVKYVDKRVKLFAGTGRMSMDETIRISNTAVELGVDAVMIVGPYYIQTSPRGIYEYYNTIAKEINGDIYIYNYPENTGYDVSGDTILKLIEENSNIIGLKDTVPAAVHTEDLIVKIKEKHQDFKIYTGYDNNFVSVVLSGGDGCIGALSNVVPEICKGLAIDIKNGDLESITVKKRFIDRLMELYTVSVPFMPAMKYLLNSMGVTMTEYCFYPAEWLDLRQIERVESLKKYILKNSI
jgi:4-hydroxy-tetrahydrodipicolinate synthase